MSSALNSTTFKDPHFLRESFGVLDELRQERQLCDVVLKTNDESFYAHRTVLAGASPYFRAMFTSDLVKRNLIEITMEDVDPRTLEKLIDFVYRGQLQITKENVHSLMAGASFLQLEQVQTICTDFLDDQ